MNSDLILNFVEKEIESTSEKIFEQVINNRNSRRNKIKLTREEYEETQIVWNLRKYLSPKICDGIDWQYKSSSETLNNGITAYQILEKINQKNTFQEFKFQKNDLLLISMRYTKSEKHKKPRPYIGNYISFIFAEKWSINTGFEHIENNYEEYKSGILLVK